MTQAEDERAASEWCEKHKCHLQMTCHKAAFLAGAEHARAELDALKKKYSEMKDGLNDVIRRQRESHNDYARETAEEIALLRDKIAELEKLASDLIAQAACASEQGARRLAEYLVHQSEYPCSSVEALMTIWRGLK